VQRDHASAEEQFEQDVRDLHQFGYQQRLRRTIGSYTSFALGFSMITITTTIFSLFTDPFNKIGGVAIWLWVPVTGGVLLITLVYAHLAARLPVTGYAYQWSSRLVSPHYGWFTGWSAMLSFLAGTASIAVAMATIFAGEIWDEPTRGNIQAFAAVAILVAVAINIIGIRAATWVNNIGASTELVGTLGLAAIAGVGLFFFSDSEGPGVLFQSGGLEEPEITLTTLGLAALLPIYTLLGWEGSADLAEETRNPRRTAPKAMLRSVTISGLAGFVVFAIFAMAIPSGIQDTVGQANENPVIYIFQQQLGTTLADLLQIVVLISVFAALLANVTVGTRMVYSLSRDNMLPGSKVLSWVSPATRTPIAAILTVGAFALIVNLLSEGLITRVVAITAVTYYLVYLLTTTGALFADSRGTMPGAPAGYFDLGRWLRPVGIAAIVWGLIVVGYMTIPEVNNVAGEYTLYAEALGLAWYVVYLRRKLKTGTAGPPRQAISPEELAEERVVERESIEVGPVAAEQSQA
jgi:amino acid transporter